MDDDHAAVWCLHDSLETRARRIWLGGGVVWWGCLAAVDVGAGVSVQGVAVRGLSASACYVRAPALCRGTSLSQGPCVRAHSRCVVFACCPRN